MDWKRIAASVLMLGVLAVPASAASITPQTTMKEIRDDPDIRASGLYTYTYVWERDCERLSTSRDDETLAEVVGKTSAEACAAGLNYLAQVYHDGTRVTYPLYSEEEIAAVPTRQKAEIYYFPGSDPGGKFVLVIGGNAIHTSAEMREGVSTAEWLNELGYTCFVLRYRIGDQAADNAPLEDVSRAVRYITEHAEQFHVQPEDYAVLAYSSGGQIAGVFGDAEKGWQKYNVPKPGALLLAYPINNFWLAKPAYTALLDVDDWMQKHYYDYTLSKLIAPDYPPVFLWYGKSDHILKLFGFDQQGPALQSALEIDGVPHEEKVYEDAGHGIGIGLGTEAEGWLNAAVAFWKKVT